MAQKTALIAGTGVLPALLAGEMRQRGAAPLIAGITGFAVEGLPLDVEFRVERLALFLEHLHDLGVDRVVFAGALQRPRLDPSQFDPKTAALVPRLLPALQGGDDGLLRAVIALFEDSGLAVAGAAEVAPGLVPGPGVLTAAEPTERDRKDAARAAAIVSALSVVDVGQGAVVAAGLCLAVEALPGTDAMLQNVAGIDAALRPDPKLARGVLFKAPKAGQDRRIDLPALGPRTVQGAAEAGLAGIAFEAGGTMLLDRATTLAEADRLGLFLWAREP